MLKFHTPPDKIFMAILTESMDLMINQIRELLAVHRKNDAEACDLTSLMPNAGRVFVPETALKTLKKMLHCHAGPGLYQLNDYHYLLLYDTLKDFCDVHNDMVDSASNEHEKQRVSKVGAFHIERLGFDDLIDIYFYNTHFLINEDTMMNLNGDKKQELGMHEETFGISQGMSPHPEELKIRDEEENPVLRVESRFWRSSSKVYPDFER
jgi:hypothetical protein